MRVQLLVQGTSKTTLEKNQHVSSARTLTSVGARCLLSLVESKATLRAYAHEDRLLDYLLDARIAVVDISAMLPASAAGAEPTYVVDSVRILSPEQLPTVKTAMLQEFDISCGILPDQPESLADVNKVKRARRLEAWPSAP